MAEEDRIRREAEAATEKEAFVELAPYMGELQRLTHKLSLSIAHDNHRLAEFYLYESLELLEDIKTDVPEYRGQPVALLIDRISTPLYRELEKAIKADRMASGGKSNERSRAALTGVLNSCNECHVATQHGFIKITDQSGVNPFNQDFKPGADAP